MIWFKHLGYVYVAREDQGKTWAPLWSYFCLDPKIKKSPHGMHYLCGSRVHACTIKSRNPKSLKTVKDLYGWVASLATQPYKSFKIFKFSNNHKISHLSNSGLKIGNLTDFIMPFSFLTTILYRHLFL